MSYEIRAEYRQGSLLPAYLEDWVGEDHPARFMRDYVDSLDLKEMGFKVRESEMGAPNYSSDLLLKVWVYGYFNRIYSSRKLERACLDHVGLIWLTGNNAPDHNTLWRFWRDHKSKFKGLLRQSIQVAMHADLVGMVLHAVDGTKIRSGASRRTAWHKKDLEKLLERVEEWLEKTEQEIQTNEREEEGECRLPKKLQDARERQRTIKDALEQLKESGEKRLHPHDREARIMPVEGKKDWAYNAQAVVDEKSGIVMAAEVTTDESDNDQLVPMLKQVEENTGSVAEENLADNGYSSGEQLEKAAEAEYEVLVSENPKESGEGKPYHCSHFTYDRENDCCYCPKGQRLEFEEERWNCDKRYKVRVYRCRGFGECPVRWQCSKNKKGRIICITPYHDVLLAQREKRSRPGNAELLRQRKRIVEPLFAWIKHAMEFRRWTYRGYENVCAQWSMLGFIMNMKKMFEHWREGGLTTLI